MVRGLQFLARMKTLALAACLLLSACSLPFDFNFDINVARDVPEQSIPGSPVAGPPAAMIALPIQVAVGSEIAAMNSGSIDSVTLGAMYLDITATGEPSGDSDDWSFVDRVDLYVESTMNGTTLPRLKVAAAVAPGAVTHLEFLPEDVNLLPYIHEGCALSAAATGRVPADEVSYDGKVTFRISPL